MSLTSQLTQGDASDLTADAPLGLGNTRCAHAANTDGGLSTLSEPQSLLQYGWVGFRQRRSELAAHFLASFANAVAVSLAQGIDNGWNDTFAATDTQDRITSGID